MSFFRNLRSSITRGRSSSRDNTPVRGGAGSRPGSVLGSMVESNGERSHKRRESIESNTDSLLNRGDTFILNESDDQLAAHRRSHRNTPNPDSEQNHSNCSTLEKKSKKSKVLEKFSTFTKRKKTPSPLDTSAYEHHPSDNATNTYYKWQSEGGGNSLDYDSQTDPFNFLYEQQSSLKSLQSSAASQPHSSLASNSSYATASSDLLKPASSFDSSTYRKPAVSSKTLNAGQQPFDSSTYRKLSSNRASTPALNQFDSSTYRKGPMPSELKQQLQHLKHSNAGSSTKIEAFAEEQLPQEASNEADKYKTVTLNSFRKSFRDKFLQQHKDAAHNPAWFVEVEPPQSPSKSRERSLSKENRTDFLVFDNDNYRPGSRSPIRDLSSRKPMRSSTRSPVKRNDTFKVNTPLMPSRAIHSTVTRSPTSPNSIRIELRNSITPNVPGRMVPVGVAKPMPLQANNYTRQPYVDSKPSYNQADSIMNTSYTIKTAGNRSPIRTDYSKLATTKNSLKPAGSSSNVRSAAKYQTLVQIRSDDKTPKSLSSRQIDAGANERTSRLTGTRIQVGGNSAISIANLNASPSFPKRYAAANVLTSSSHNRAQPLKETYFGNPNAKAAATTTVYATSKYAPSYASTATTSPTKLYGNRATTNAAATSPATAKYGTTTTTITSSLNQNRLPPSHSVHANNNSYSYLRQQQQQQYQQHQQQQQHQQPRVVPVTQRRSRSPIKVPWR